MTEDKGRIFVEYTVVAVVNMIYTMGTSYITSMFHGLSTMKETYIYVLYLFVDSSSWADPKSNPLR